MTIKDQFNLERFVNAQKQNYESILVELRSGWKITHWSWYIFPQLRGLGSSSMSIHFSISGLQEASVYLAHPVLGSRLVECIAIMNSHLGKSAAAILGDIDAMKFHACITLFAQIPAYQQTFQQALAGFFANTPHAATMSLLATPHKTW
jgi:uncharacterized protein (DUF1810 family)